MTTNSGIQWIDMDIINRPKYPRYHDPAKMESLIASIRKGTLLEPVILIPSGDGRFDLLAGDRRFLACQKLEWKQIQAQVREGLSEFDKLRITYEENEEREQAGPVYDGRLFKAMMAAEKCNAEQLAQKLGKSRTVVYDAAAVADLDEDLQQKFSEKGLSSRQIKDILRLPSKADRLAMADECAAQDLNGQALSARVGEILDKQEEPEGKACDICQGFKTREQPHQDCGFVEKLRLYHLLFQAVIRAKGGTEEQKATVKFLESRLQMEEEAFKLGKRPNDGKPWNSPESNPPQGDPNAWPKIENILWHGMREPSIK